MSSTPLLAGPLVTTVPFTTEWQWWAIGIAGLTIASLLATFTIATTSTRTVAIVGITMALGSTFLIGSAYVKSGTHVNEKLVAEGITESYIITSPKPREGLIVKTDPDKLCQPVSTDSPEYTGIVRGQEITFKVGITDCTENKPEIIVVDTPGQPISANQIEKDPTP